MSIINYPSSSPYAVTLQSSWYLGNYVHRKITPASDDTLMQLTSKYNSRPDLLSYDLYSTPVYWWIFMARNLNIIRDPLRDFKEGIIIYVPSLNHVRELLGN